MTDEPNDPTLPSEADGGDAKRRYLEALERKKSRGSAPGQGPGSAGAKGGADTHGHTQRTFRRKSGGGG